MRRPRFESLRTRLTGLVALTLIAAGCVWPVPLPGDPVPTIESTATWDASAATVTLTVTTTDLTADRVWVFPAGVGAPAIRDDATPFELTIPAASLTPGAPTVLVLAEGGGTWVGEQEPVPDVRCNGQVDLCTRAYDTVRTVTTHNAMSNSTDGWIGPNHHLDVPGQLAAGVRGLMLDTYRAGDLNSFGLVQVPGVDPDTPYLCHTICALGSEPLVDGLTEIRTFLDAEPGAVVTLILESYLSHTLTAGAFDAAGLTPMTYVHGGGAWPTLGEMIHAGTRLVVLTDDTEDPAHPWLMYVWDLAFETHFSNSVPEDFSCADNRGSPSNDLFILNHFLTDVFGSPDLADLVNHNPFLGDRAAECEAFHSTAATFVTVDFTSIGDVHEAVAMLNGVLTPSP